MDTILIKRYLSLLASAMLLITFFGYFSVKIWDIDFWWHIAAGREIIASGSIPSQDPFGVYNASNYWGQTVLKSQWLGQVILYEVFRLAGIDGIVYFRAAMLAACLGLVLARSRLSKVGLMPSMFVLALAGMAISTHTGERPQLFSFVCLAVEFLLLDLSLHKDRAWPLYLLPPLFLFWVNTHGGVMYGAAMLVMFVALYAVEGKVWHGNRNRIQSRHLLIVAALCLLALLAAPNGLNTLKYIAYPEYSPIRGRTSEYMSPWSLWPATIYFWIYIAVTLVSLPGFISKQNIKYGILVLAAGIISLTAYRYVPLFVVLSAPYVAASLGRMFSRISVSDQVTSYSVLVISVIFLILGYTQGRTFQHGIMEHRFPEVEVSLIKSNHLAGRIFNTMNWGGYLIWNLSPAVTVFLDGRLLDPTRIEAYTNILWMTPAGQQFFEQGNFDLVLIPPGNSFTGEQYPLVEYLRNNPAWRIFYQSNTGYLFVRPGG